MHKLPIVFGGPSLSSVSEQHLKAVELRPPAARGDLAALLTREPGTALLVDGLFGSSMAVSPAECRDLLMNGWILCGAASIGAIRAAELWSVGMIGFGEIYSLMRLDKIQRDDEVAVAYHADNCT